MGGGGAECLWDTKTAEDEGDTWIQTSGSAGLLEGVFYIALRKYSWKQVSLHDFIFLESRLNTKKG